MMSYVGTGEADSRATGMFIALGPDGTESVSPLHHFAPFPVALNPFPQLAFDLNLYLPVREIGDLHHEIPFARVTWGLKHFEKNIFFGSSSCFVPILC